MAQKKREAPATPLRTAADRLLGFTVTDAELAELELIIQRGEARPAPGFEGRFLPPRPAAPVRQGA